MQAHLVPDGERLTDPGLFHKTLRTPHRLQHDVGTKALDLETPLRIAFPEPVKRGCSQEMDRRAVEKRPRWESEIGDGVPVVEAFEIRPVLSAFAVQAAGRDDRTPAIEPRSVTARVTSRLSAFESAWLRSLC